jgi:hypothetical protein
LTKPLLCHLDERLFHAVFYGQEPVGVSLDEGLQAEAYISHRLPPARGAVEKDDARTVG